MAKIDFKSLSPEEVAALSGKDKTNYEKWLAKQVSGGDVDDSSVEEEIDLIEVEPVNFQVNTSVYGHLYPGKKYKISAALAGQLADAGVVKIVK